MLEREEMRVVLIPSSSGQSFYLRVDYSPSISNLYK